MTTTRLCAAHPVCPELSLNDIFFSFYDCAPYCEHIGSSEKLQTVLALTQSHTSQHSTPDGRCMGEGKGLSRPQSCSPGDSTGSLRLNANTIHGSENNTRLSHTKPCTAPALLTGCRAIEPHNSLLWVDRFAELAQGTQRNTYYDSYR